MPTEPKGDLDTVERAIGDLVLRHESLRTLVDLGGGEPQQRLANAGRLPLRVVEAEPDTTDATGEALLNELRPQGFRPRDRMAV